MTRDRCAHSHPRLRRGTAIVYLTVAMTAMLGFCSLAVDLGRVQLAKTQLRRTADAAARYAAKGVSDGTAVTKAQDAANDNVVDGQTFSLPSANVVTGTWSTSTGFTSGGANQDSVQISTTYNVPLLFAQAMGFRTCRITAKSVARYVNNPVGGLIGLNGITFKNNTFIASYNSAVTTTPSQSNYNSNGGIGSNAIILGKNGNALHGDVILGPSGTISNVAISGSTTNRTTAIPSPTMPTWSPGTNPNSIPQNYTVSSSTTLAGGTYWFTSLTISAPLTFSGAATIYVNGNITIDDDLTAYHSIPSNLRVYQYGTSTFGDSSNNNVDVVADFWAPTVDLSFKNNFSLRGRAYYNSMTFKNNADLYYDEAFGPASGGTTISTVQ